MSIRNILIIIHFMLLFPCIQVKAFANDSNMHKSDTLKAKVYSDTVIMETSDTLVQSIIDHAMTYLKKPYCYGGKGDKCFDCSGFVIKIFAEHGIDLPSSSTKQAFCGNFISTQHALPGDLIFFNGRKANCETVGHVGIITQIEEDEIYFIHASVQSGVIISKLSEPYYAARFLCVKNVLTD